MYFFEAYERLVAAAQPTLADQLGSITGLEARQRIILLALSRLGGHWLADTGISQVEADQALNDVEKLLSTDIGFEDEDWLSESFATSVTSIFETILRDQDNPFFGSVDDKLMMAASEAAPEQVADFSALRRLVSNLRSVGMLAALALVSSGYHLSYTRTNADGSETKVVVDKTPVQIGSVLKDMTRKDSGADEDADGER